MSGLVALAGFRHPTDPSEVERMAAAAPYRGSLATVAAPSGAAVLGHQNRTDPAVYRDGPRLVVADARLDAGTAGVAAARRIAAVYRRWGTGTAARLTGDFAFVIWDDEARLLYGARDPMGLRPMYYRYEPGRVLVASEVKQILAATGVPARLHEAALAAYLVGLVGPLEWTFYEGIHQLPPAHHLTVSAAGAGVARYRDFDPEPLRFDDDRDYETELRDRLRAAVARRIPAGGRFGVMLSGGLDSGAIGAMAARVGPGRVTAFTWAFDDLAECDERRVSHPLAAHVGMPVVDVPADESWPLRDDVATDPDSPFTSSPYQVMHEDALRRAGEHGVATMLWGSAGDLIVGDYDDPYLAPFLRGRWQDGWERLQAAAEYDEVGIGGAAVQHLVRPLANRLWPPGRLPAARRRVWETVRRVRGTSPWPAWLHLDAAQRLDLAAVAQADQPRPPRGGAFQRRYALIHQPWQAQASVWLNRTHARFGVEYADPWSDPALVDFALAVPPRLLWSTPDDPYKPFLRRALAPLLAETVLAEMGKVVPSPLYGRGVNDRARPVVEELLARPRLAELGLVDAEALRVRLTALHDAGDVSGELWYVLSAEQWLKNHWE